MMRCCWWGTKSMSRSPITRTAKISFLLYSASFCYCRYYHHCCANAFSFILMPPTNLPVLSSQSQLVQSRKGRCSRRFMVDQSSSSDIDLLKWERLYYGGERMLKNPMNDNVISENNNNSSSSNNNNFETRTTKQTISQVRVVSFDLDDTLWKTSPTIAAANDALAAFLENHSNITTAKPMQRVELVMQDLFRANKERYCPVEKNSAKAPVLLTLLRKDAIQKVISDCSMNPELNVSTTSANNNEGEEEEVTAVNSTATAIHKLVDEAFDVWNRARHDAIPSHLAQSVISCLQSIRSIRTAEGHQVLIGAITDGNSDPRLLLDRHEQLGGYFDFCINAERVGVGKPDKRVYLQALSEVISHPSLRNVVGLVSASPSASDGADTGSSTSSVNEDMFGPWWVHIGDDFIKDVVAAKELGLRSVWCRELILDKVNTTRSTSSSPSSSSRNVEDLVKQVSETKVVRMQIGSDDYLAESFHNEFADFIVDRFDHLGTLLNVWHNEALLLLEGDGNGNDYGESRTQQIIPRQEEEPDNRELQSMSSSTSTIAKEPQQQQEQVTPVAPASTAIRDFKFCIRCGGKLPSVAAFCSSCGQKQS